MPNLNDELMTSIKKIADPNGVVAKFGALIGNIEAAEAMMGGLEHASHESRAAARRALLDRILKSHREFVEAGGTMALVRSL